MVCWPAAETERARASLRKFLPRRFRARALLKTARLFAVIYFRPRSNAPLSHEAAGFPGFSSFRRSKRAWLAAELVTWVLAARFVRVIYACVKHATRSAAFELGGQQPSWGWTEGTPRGADEERKSERDRWEGRGRREITIYTSGLRTAQLFTRDFLFMPPSSHPSRPARNAFAYRRSVPCNER